MKKNQTLFKFRLLFSFRFALIFLFLCTPALLFCQHRSVRGKWVADLRSYTEGSLIHQKMVYTISPKILYLKITTSKQNKKVFFDHHSKQSNTYTFAIEKTMGSRKNGQFILKIPASISGKTVAQYGILGFSRKNAYSLRVQFSLNKIYASVAKAQKHRIKATQGVLLISQSQYKAYQQLPILPALTPTSFKQLRTSIQQQLQKSVYRKQIKQLDKNRHLHSEIPGQVFLQKGYNPYQSMQVLIDYQLKMVDSYKRQSLRVDLLHFKQQLKLLTSGKHADKHRQKAEINTAKLAMRLTQKKLAYLDLKQKYKQHDHNTQQQTRIEAQLKQLRQQIEVLTQQQFKAPDAPMKFKPVRN